jgi:hypothetical protein
MVIPHSKSCSGCIVDQAKDVEIDDRCGIDNSSTCISVNHPGTAMTTSVTPV